MITVIFAFWIIALVATFYDKKNFAYLIKVAELLTLR